jgi:hypothetical protein
VTDERRRKERLAMTMPVRVSGFASNGRPWTEMSTVKDVSPSGVSFVLRHPVTRGHVLHLALPLPKRFRAYDLGEASYHVYALVRSTTHESAGVRVGLMFLGKQPPRHFEREPAGLYLLPNDPMPGRARPTPATGVPGVALPADEPAAEPDLRERRQHTRLDVFVNVRLTRQDGVPGPLEERTIAENIGRGGARVISMLQVARGEVLMLTEVDGDFETRAEVRDIFYGPDNIPRLSLKFLDDQAPDRLVATS